ncbi:MAG: 2-hydroxyacyl-CoA dehydratase family protein [Rhodospirillales bacterium]|nr:2-hydroxyacyl-CoA dehydratase family protein [Rhodospirillales bacterium]
MTDSVRYFTAWEGKSLEQIFHLARELAEDPCYPTVAKWRQNGGQVLGHFQVYFPEEIAHAAGMLPVKIKGAQSDGTEAESRFGSYLCSIIKTSLDIALTKDIELDLFVTHPICDAARNLGAIWGRNFDYKCQILYLPQNPNSKFAQEYLRNEYQRVVRDIEAATGRTISDRDLKNSIEVYNRGRALLRDLYEIRRASPWLIGADDSLALISLAGFLPREEFNDLLETVLDMIRVRPARKQDKMRVVFEGGFCEMPPIDLLQTVSRSCYVVDDDLLIGLRFILDDVPTAGDHLDNLAHAYIENSSYSPVQHDLRKPKEKMLLERIKDAGAEAVILAAAKMCEPGLEEQVAYSKELDDEKIPYFISEFEENQTTFDHLAIQLETFVENIMFD